MHRRTSKSLFANRPARRAAHARLKAERVSQRSAERVYAMQRKRESRVQRWRQAFPTRFVPVNLSRFSALWAAVLSLFTDVLKAPTNRRRASAGFRARTSGLGFFQPLEERAMLAADVYVDDSADFTITNDIGDAGLSAGDEVTWLVGTASEQPNLIFGTDAFDSIQAGIAGVSAAGTVHVAPGEYESPVSTVGADIGAIDGETVAGDRAILKTPVGSPATLLTNDASLTLTDLTLRASNSGDTLFSNSGTLAFGASNEIEIAVDESNVGTPTSFAITIDGSAITSLIAGDTKGSVSAAGATITYTPVNTVEGPDTATFSFATNDGTSGVVDVVINAVNDAPVVTAGGGASPTFTEGGAAVVVDAGVSVSDVDDTMIESASVAIAAGLDADDLLTVTAALPGGVTTSYAAGVLTISGTATVAEYETLLQSVTFENTGGNPASVAASRVIEFKVNDGDVDSLAASAGVAIDAVNDAPVEEKVGDDTVVEGGTTQIHGRNNDGDVVGSSDLVFSDVDDAETDIVYEIVSVTNGTLRIGGGAYGSGALLGVGDTFTQDDLNSATGNGSTRVRFDHDGSETASAGFTFIVRDAAGAESADANATTPGEFLLTVTPDNDAPVVAVNDGLTVTEGDLDTSLAGTLGATDVDDTDAGLVYTIASVPANGTLKLSGTPLAASDTFTQAQLDAGDVTYSQETPNQPSDSFTFTVMDDDNAATVVATYDITINQVNDPLSITTNLGLTVVEGGSQSLNTRLDTTDADTVDADIVYTVTSGPANGSLSLTSFTQAQLDAGDVTYSHNGGETTSDSFAFDVTDGLTVLSSTFAVSVTPVNDTPVVTAPTDIVATQEVASALGGTFSITDADIPGQTLTATLSVSNGALAVPGTPTDVTVGGTPTALTLTGTAAAITAALNGGEVTYTGDPGVAGDDADLLTIDVSDGTATGSTTANLDIVDVNDPPTFDPLVDQVATEDDPTQTVAGFLANVDTIESGQGYTVSVSNDNTSLFTAGGQPTIDKATGDLTYTPAPDAFGTAVVTVTVTDDGVGTTGGSNSTSQTFEIEVTGVDEPPVVTTNPLTINEGDTVTLTTSKLSVTDPETPAADLDITATSVPAGLQLELASAPGTAITTFTYEQLQLGQVKVVDLDPAGLIGSAAIDFEVTDGTAATATPVSASLTVNVTPVNDAPVVDNSSSTAATFTEGGAAVAIADAITITDVDNTELVSATIAITDPVAGDLLTVGGLSGSITVDLTDDGSNGVLKLIGPGTLAEFAATIAMIEFSSSSSDPTVNDTQTTRSISVQVDDGAASDNLGSTTISVGVTAVNDAPVLASANDGQTLTFTEEQPAVTLFGDLSIADDDGASERFESATLTITNFQSGQDVVSFTAVAGLTVVLDDTTTPGVMVVSVTSDAANTVEASAYETLLQSIAFENTSDAPVTAPNRGVTLIVNDGDDDSNTLTAAIEVVGENDAPEVTTGSVTIAEGSNNANSNYITPALLSVTDADGVDPATIVYTLTEILNGDGVTANTGLVQLRYRDGSSDTMILGVGDTFTQADINSWSEGASTGAGDNVGLRVRSFGADATTTAGAQATLKFSVDLADPGAPLAVDFVVGITPVNDVPSAGGSPGTVTLDEKVDDVEVPQDITGFTHTDEETTDSGTLTIKVTGISTGETLGTLLINGSPYMAGVNETLTQAQANSGGLQYVHTSDDQPVGGAEVTVDYQVLDADGGVRNGRSFDIAFTPQNDSPIAVDDTFTGVFEDDGNATLGNVLAANPTDADADPEGGALTVTEVNGEAADVGSEITLPSGALLTLNANGTFDYNPNGAFEDLAGGEPGSDTFTYQVTDPDSGVGAATVTVVITGQNDLPVVTAGLEFDLAENSGVGAEVGAVSATDIDAIDTIADFMITGGDAGFAIDSSGLITTTTDFDFESVGSPTLTVMVAAQDSFGAWSNPVLVTINLLDINDLPSVDTNAGLTVLEGGSGSLATKLSASDDEDASADLIYTVATGPANGSLSLTTFTQADVDAGLVIYSHDGGETVTDSFTFTVEDLNDPAGVTTEQTFSITVTPVNDAPVATPNPLSITVDKDSTITFDALAIVDAIEGGQVVTLTGVGSTSAGGSSVLASLGTGMITYTPNGSVGTDTFTYTVMDNGGTANGGADTTTVTVNVTIEDLAPDAQDDDAVVTEGGMVTVDLFADNGNGVDVSGQAGAPTITEVAGVAFTPGMSVTLSGGTLTHVPGGSGGEFEYQSDLAEEISEEVFQYTISDGTTPDTATVTIDVTDVADVVPFITSLSGDTGGSEGDTLSFTVVATDGDSDPVLTYDWDFGDGTQVFGVTASESHTYTEKGNYTVTVTVSDRGQSASASAGVSIIDDVAPEVASVRVGSLDWSTSFVDFVDASMGLGYSVTEGEAPLPWVNLDVIHVTFSEEVQKIGGGTITVDDIQLIGVNNVSPSIASFSYDNSTFTATITLFDPIGAEKLLVYVDGSDVEDDAGNSVDGSDSTRIDIVPGDANRSSLVSPTDLGFANGKKLLGTGDAGYSIYADVNGSGTVTGTDVNDIRLRQFSALPSGSPVTPAPAAAPVLTASPISVRAASVVEPAVAPASDSAASAGDDSVLLVLSGGRPTSSLSSKPALAQAPPASYEDQSLLLYLQDSASLTPDAEVVEAAAGSEDNETEEERDEAIGQLFGSAF